VLALLAMLVVYMYRLRIGSRLVVPVLLLALLLSFMPSAFYGRFQEAPKSGGSGRLDIWTVGLVAFQHYGLVGAGLNNFPFAYTNYANAAKFQGFDRDAHNIYLSIAVESGVVGLLLFFLAVRAQLRGIASPPDNQEGVDYLRVATEAVAWGLLVYGFFGTIVWSKEFWFAWMLLGGVIGVSAESAKALSPQRTRFELESIART
jgi:O-antigen ligase